MFVKTPEDTITISEVCDRSFSFLRGIYHGYKYYLLEMNEGWIYLVGGKFDYYDRELIEKMLSNPRFYHNSSDEARFSAEADIDYDIFSA